jgi:hypothetical protein
MEVIALVARRNRSSLFRSASSTCLRSVMSIVDAHQAQRFVSCTLEQLTAPRSNVRFHRARPRAILPLQAPQSPRNPSLAARPMPGHPDGPGLPKPFAYPESRRGQAVHRLEFWRPRAHPSLHVPIKRPMLAAFWANRKRSSLSNGRSGPPPVVPECPVPRSSLTDSSWGSRQCVEAIPSNSPDRETSGVVCAARTPALRCSSRSSLPP